MNKTFSLVLGGFLLVIGLLFLGRVTSGGNADTGDYFTPLAFIGIGILTLFYNKLNKRKRSK